MRLQVIGEHVWKLLQDTQKHFFKNTKKRDLCSTQESGTEVFIPVPLSSARPYIIFSLIVSTIYFTSSSLTYGPAGRHIPTLKRPSDTPFTYAGASL